MSVTEQRYKSVEAVLFQGETVTQVPKDWGVSRQTIHGWLAKYEGDGLEGLGNRSRQPMLCPNQMPAIVEAQLLEIHRAKPYWGASRHLPR